MQSADIPEMGQIKAGIFYVNSHFHLLIDEYKFLLLPIVESTLELGAIISLSVLDSLLPTSITFLPNSG